MASEAETRPSGNVPGSTLLAPLSRTIGIPLDQVNFIFCQVVALVLGYPFRKFLTPAAVGPNVRHGVQIFTGVVLLLFCFGQQSCHLLAQAAACVAVMKYVKSGWMAPLVMAISLGYLCVCHIQEQVYGGYILDFTGPLMIQTQRLSSFAFSLADGRAKDRDKLNAAQRKQAIDTFPRALEFVSYLCSFHMIMCGPFCFYNDYIDFVNGTNVKGKQIKGNISPRYAVLRKVSVAAACCVMVVAVAPFFPVGHLKDQTFFNRDFLSKISYIFLLTTAARFKYYFAWYLATAVNNSAGLGYRTGEAGNGTWDLVDNVEIRGVELSLSMKELLDTWNVKTSHWLRHCVYERVPAMNTFCVFAVSVVWHGFYPGFYLCFSSAAAMIFAGRAVRRTIRPWFVTSPARHTVYDVMTFTATRLAVAYISFSHVLLEFWASLRVYSALYFYLHVAAIVAIAVLPAKRSRS